MRRFGSSIKSLDIERSAIERRMPAICHSMGGAVVILISPCFVQDV
jgi:hypothetical protein